MKKRTVIGIVGQGFVGKAIKEGFSRDIFLVETYDKYQKNKSSCESLGELVEKAKIIFVCVPTPMKRDGSCDLSIVYDVISQLDQMSTSSHVVVLKSTVPPGTTSTLNNTCENMQVVFNPEFLTEANYLSDFKNQNYIIIGGPRPASTLVKNLYRKAFNEIPIIKTSSSTAETVKYFINCFLATKVSFANEFKQICNQLDTDVDYDKVLEYALYDGRIGKTHLSAPGPDGKPGFGGSCFPKDINAFLTVAKEADVDPKILQAAWDKNLEVRPEKDWEKLIGRAVAREDVE